MGCHFLLQRIFPTQGLNPCLPHYRQMLYHLSHQGSPWCVCMCVCVCVCVYIYIYICVCMCVLSRFSHVRLFATPWTVAHQVPLCMGFSRQKYWSGLPCPPPGDLPDPGIEPWSLCLPYWQTASLLLPPPGKPIYIGLLNMHGFASKQFLLCLRHYQR